MPPTSGNFLNICPSYEGAGDFYDEIYGNVAGSGGCDVESDETCVFYATCLCPNEFSPSKTWTVGDETGTYVKRSNIDFIAPDEPDICVYSETDGGDVTNDITPIDFETDIGAHNLCVGTI